MLRIAGPAFILAAAWWLWFQFVPIYRLPGITAPREPQQVLLPPYRSAINIRGWKVRPLAVYRIDARVLSKTSYEGDPAGDLLPYDLAVGWGRMSDTAVIRKLDIGQSFRFYRWSYWGEPPIPRDEIVSHSCNMHIIPGSERVQRQISLLRTGSLVRLSGYLVEAIDGKDGTRMTSSLTRTDSGAGACEIMLVQSVQERD